ncbi:hypothetical protein GP486_005773 [Trichoglossum hirsutum]|uniref:Uncharacterized protein n=1 Tax=Trichoglossum hirsutum TaxID=265104 RepID=A0A9P8RM29_9PEZI|nr:hypothetical protein GP486_005773 [Trichoglossum hirsutum]
MDSQIPGPTSTSSALDRGVTDGSTSLNANSASKRHRSINASGASTKPPWNAGPGWNGRQIRRQQATIRLPPAILNSFSDPASSSESEDLDMPSTPSDSCSLEHLSHVQPLQQGQLHINPNRFVTQVARLKHIPIRPTSPTEIEWLWQQVRTFNECPTEEYTDSYSGSVSDQLIYGHGSTAARSKDKNSHDAASNQKGGYPVGVVISLDPKG